MREYYLEFCKQNQNKNTSQIDTEIFENIKAYWSTHNSDTIMGVLVQHLPNEAPTFKQLMITVLHTATDLNKVLKRTEDKHFLEYIAKLCQKNNTGRRNNDTINGDGVGSRSTSSSSSSSSSVKDTTNNNRKRKYDL